MITTAPFLTAAFLLAQEPQQAVRNVAPRFHEYAIDPGHSIVEFSIGFALTRVKGRFTQWRGTILYDSINPANSSVTAIIETRSIDTGWPNRDRHLRTSDFFDVEKFPTITFRSERLRFAGDSWVAEGQLTMHGVTRSVNLPFRFLPSSPSRSPESRTMLLNASGNVRLTRTDFGILGGSTYNSWFTRARSATMSDSVEISMEVEGWRADATTYRTPAIEAALARLGESGLGAHLQRLLEQRTRVAGAEWPRYFRGQDFLIRALLNSNRARDAVALATALTDLFPGSADPYLILGFSHSSAADDDAAASAYARAKALYSAPPKDTAEQFPQDDERWYYVDHLVQTALEAGRTREAVGLARVVAEIYSGIARAHSRYGQALALAGRYREAEAAFDRALQTDPMDTRALEYRRRLLPSAPRDTGR